MNYPHFDIGEVAVYWRPDSIRHNTEVTISGPLETIFVLDNGGSHSMLGHKITAMCPLGGNYVADIRFLRKKPTKDDDSRQVTSWDKCIFKPKSINA